MYNPFPKFVLTSRNAGRDLIGFPGVTSVANYFIAFLSLSAFPLRLSAVLHAFELALSISLFQTLTINAFSLNMPWARLTGLPLFPTLSLCRTSRRSRFSVLCL